MRLRRVHAAKRCNWRHVHGLVLRGRPSEQGYCLKFGDMTDKGSKKPVNNFEDVTEIDDLDVPTTDVYTRTGKAAPTEVPPAAPKQENITAPSATEKPVDIAVDRVGESSTSVKPDASVEEPVAASTVSTAGTLHTTAAAEGIGTDPAVTEPEPANPPVARGTIDFGLLILRVVLGAVLILTSLAVLFQLGGNPGLAGLEEDLASQTFPHVLAIALPTMGLAAGVFLVLGLLTPIAAMVAVAATGFGVLDAVSGAENPVNLFAWDASTWLAVVLLGMALSIQFTGPGVLGIDFNRSWARRPLASSWICAVIGIAAAISLWIFV